MHQPSSRMPVTQQSSTTNHPTLQSHQCTRGQKRAATSPEASSCRDPESSRKRLKTRTSGSSALESHNGHQSQLIYSSPPRSHDDLSEILGTSELRHSPDIYDRMDEEMQLFPGSKDWADDELRLFRILFLREHGPLLPREWSMDFRGIPVPEILFSRSESFRPIIYSMAGNTFKATRALIRLIDLTTTVRTLVQTGQKGKLAPVIRKELDEYAKWAAQDGGFGDLDIIPNLIIDAVDIALGSDKIEEYMQSRMKSLAVEHRNYWKIERVAEDEAWKLPKLAMPEVKTEDDGEEDLGRPQEAPLPVDAENAWIGPTNENLPRVVKSEDSEEPITRLEARYTQRPPVLYGIFVIHHSAVVLTIDSSKEGDDAYVSYQVEAGFNVKFQGVWNAITMAIVVCLARDHMVTMANDFVQLVDSPESDPDV